MSTDFLPLFPLGMVVFPTEPVLLHIFEPRYRQMVANCEPEGREFGMVLSTDDQLEQVGCALVIDRILERMDDGRLHLIARGTRRFVMERRLPGTAESEEASGKPLYDQAEVSWLTDTSQDWDDELATKVFQLHRLLLQWARGGDPDVSTYNGLNKLSFTAGSASGLDPETKQKILELRDENSRLEALASHLSHLLRQLQAVASLKEEVDQKWRLFEED